VSLLYSIFEACIETEPRNISERKEDMIMSSSLKPPFTREMALLKVKAAEDSWNSCDPERVALAYTPDSQWRNRTEFLTGREAIKAFLRRKWAKELDYRLMKELWCYTDNRISVPRVHILTPIPGTPLYDTMRAEGRILVEDFTQYSGGRVVFKPRLMEPERLQQKYWNMYERLFSWKGILHRVGRNHAGLEPYMSAFVFGVNLHYRAHIHRRITPGIV